MIPLLKGLRILDLTTVILGPYATQILGDLGAEIIKVEPPEGDSMRPVAPVGAPGISAIFANSNRNKRSIALDLKAAEGRSALMKLIPTADAFLHNMRQRALDRLGFSYAAVSACHSNIIYAAADWQTVTSLARILQRAGCVRAMQLDINPEWPTMNIYAHRQGGLVPIKVVPNDMQPAMRYLVPDDRDFFAVYRRLPGPVSVPFG